MSDAADPHPPGRLAKTLSYYGAFIGLGLVIASLGPTLPGLADLTGASLGSLSTIFVARSAGYMSGAMLGGRLFDRFPGQPVLAGMIALMAACMAVVPLSPTVAVLTAVLYVLGFGEGALDAGGNTLLVWLYPTGLGPWMNGLHFFFGVGALLAPLIVAYIIDGGGTLAHAYWTLAACLVPFALFVAVLPSPPIASHAADRSSLRSHRTTIWLVAGLLFAAVGAEVGYGNWIYTYAITRELADATSAAALTSAYWGAFTAGRLIGIPVAARTSPTAILLVCFVAVGVSSAAILVRPDAAWLLWAGTVAAGLAVAPTFATVIALAEQRMPISGRATGWFFVGSSAGGMSIPWIIGQGFESIGTAWTLGVILVDVFVGLGVLVIFHRIRMKGFSHGGHGAHGGESLPK